jgi:adenylate cyclase class 2
MKETEVKVLEIDRKKVVRSLLSLGARKVGEGRQRTIIFDHPDGRLEKQRSFLRLRNKYGRSFVTFKRLVSQKNVRTSEEIEFDVKDFGSAETLFSKLGLEKKGDFESRRATYRIGKVIFEIDEYPGVPPYLEIEAPRKIDVEKFIAKLGFDRRKVKSWPGRKLFQHYGKNLY